MPEVTHPIKKLWPAERTEKRALAQLSGYKLNSRVHTAEQIKQIAASITQWGWTIPILIDEQNTVIAGHARMEAAKLLGITEVPCIIASGWSDEQKRAYVIADNKLTENGGWDDVLLRDELKALGAADFELPLLGFSDQELGVYLYADASGLTDPDDIPAVPETPVSQTGDVWVLGRHRLVCGDATNAEDLNKTFNGVEDQLMITDPPYGVDYTEVMAGRTNQKKGGWNPIKNDNLRDNELKMLLVPAFQVSHCKTAFVWFAHDQRNFVEAALKESGFEIKQEIVWVKSSLVFSRADYHWRHEQAIYATKKGHKQPPTRDQTTVWEIDKAIKSEHPTQKPIELYTKAILNHTDNGDVVFDPFCGSGTLIIAAEKTGRCAVGLEISPQYVDVSVKRWQAFTGKQAIHEATGQPFDTAKAA